MIKFHILCSRRVHEPNQNKKLCVYFQIFGEHRTTIPVTDTSIGTHGKKGLRILLLIQTKYAEFVTHEILTFHLQLALLQPFQENLGPSGFLSEQARYIQEPWPKKENLKEVTCLCDHNPKKLWPKNNGYTERLAIVTKKKKDIYCVYRPLHD